MSLSPIIVCRTRTGHGKSLDRTMSRTGS
jgi:hypothetical protein